MDCDELCVLNLQKKKHISKHSEIHTLFDIQHPYAFKSLMVNLLYM